MTDNATPAAPAPAATPAAAAPPATDVAARIAEIENVLHTNIDRYHQEGLSDELLSLRRSVDAGEEQVEPGEEGDADTDDGSELDADAGDAEGDDTTEETGAEVGEQEAVEPDLEYDREDFVFSPPADTKVTEIGQQRIDQFADDAHKSGQHTPESFEWTINWYNQFVQQEQARLVENDKSAKAELVKGLKSELGDSYASFAREVDTAFRELPKDLRSALRSARLPDGRLLASMPETMHLLRSLRQASHVEWRGDEAKGRDRSMTIRQELDEIEQAMNQDVANLFKPWKATGQLATDYKLQLMRELSGTAPPKPNAAELQSELRELEALRSRDPRMYSLGSWRQTGRPASDRHAAILRGRG